jgi:hypothetical protein
MKNLRQLLPVSAASAVCCTNVVKIKVGQTVSAAVQSVVTVLVTQFLLLILRRTSLGLCRQLRL